MPLTFLYAITSPYVHSRVDSNTFTMGNPMPESTLTLCQSRLYPSVRDFGFGLCSLLCIAIHTAKCYCQKIVPSHWLAVTSPLEADVTKTEKGWVSVVKLLNKRSHDCEVSSTPAYAEPFAQQEWSFRKGIINIREALLTLALCLSDCLRLTLFLFGDFPRLWFFAVFLYLSIRILAKSLLSRKWIEQRRCVGREWGRATPSVSMSLKCCGAHSSGRIVKYDVQRGRPSWSMSAKWN